MSPQEVDASRTSKPPSRSLLLGNSRTTSSGLFTEFRRGASHTCNQESLLPSIKTAALACSASLPAVLSLQPTL